MLCSKELLNSIFTKRTNLWQVFKLIFFKGNTVEMILLNSDREFDTGIIVSLMAKMMRIQIGLILPDNIAGQESCFSIRKPILNYGPFYRLLSKLYPQNFIEFKGKYYSYYSKWNLLPMAFHPCRSSNPWYEGFGKFTEKIYHRFDLDAKEVATLKSKGVIILKVKDESVMFLYRNSNAVPSKQVLLAFPQFWEQGVFERQEAIAEQKRIVSELLSRYSEVHVSMHPRMQLFNYSWLAKMEKVQIISEPFYKVLHDYSCIACINSSVMNYLDVIERELIVFKYSQLSYTGFERFMERKNTTIISFE